MARRLKPLQVIEVESLLGARGGAATSSPRDVHEAMYHARGGLLNPVVMRRLRRPGPEPK